MRRSLRHRTLCALAALSIVFSAAPASLTATSLVGDRHACSVSDGPAVSGTEQPEAALAVAVTAADLDPRGQPCEPGPCSMPFTTCAGPGACLSMVPLPVGASPTLSPGLVGVATLGTEGELPSPVSGILTPPPRS